MNIAPYNGFYVGLADILDILTGKVWMELCHSYDGIQWRREPVPIPFIGLRTGFWGSVRVHPVMSMPLLDMGDEIWIYYSGSSVNHHIGEVYGTGGIGLKTLKRDRFVGYVAGEYEGELITAPISRPSAIGLNADTRPDGWLRVELIGVDGEEIDGFDIDSCSPITSDGVSLPARFSGSIERIKFPQVRLRIRLRNATLFGTELAESTTDF